MYATQIFSSVCNCETKQRCIDPLCINSDSNHKKIHQPVFPIFWHVLLERKYFKFVSKFCNYLFCTESLKCYISEISLEKEKKFLQWNRENLHLQWDRFMWNEVFLFFINFKATCVNQNLGVEVEITPVVKCLKWGKFICKEISFLNFRKKSKYMSTNVKDFFSRVQRGANGFRTNKIKLFLKESTSVFWEICLKPSTSL